MNIASQTIVTWTFILPYVIAAENKKESVLLVTIIGMIIIILFAILPALLADFTVPPLLPWWTCRARCELMVCGRTE
jgi:hypothetical protein